jgi:hypothetical protein
MSPIGRLFFEISGDSSKLNASLREAIATAKDGGVQITRAGSKTTIDMELLSSMPLGCPRIRRLYDD